VERTAGEAARYRTLLEITNAVVSNLTREALFHAIARALRRVMPFDRTAIFLHDPERDVLRLSVLESSLPSDYFAVGLEMTPVDSHVGRVFQTRQPLRRRDLMTEREFPMEERALADGVRSYVVVPLVARGTSLGALAVASTRPDQYSEADVSFFQEAANQVALAVENMKAYEEIMALSARLQTDYVQLQEETDRRRVAEELLRTITVGTASVTGEQFFSSLVRHLAAAFQVPYAFVTECVGKSRVRTLAFWKGEGFAENVEYDVAGTPCEDVLNGEIRCHVSNLQALFPKDTDLRDLAAESYLGMPLFDSSGGVVGHLAVLDTKPMVEDSRTTSVMQVFAARAGTEVKRLRAEQELRVALREIEALKSRLHEENLYLQEEIRRTHHVEELVGSSPALLRVLQQVEQVASTGSTVLIAGETGTGKELVARAIHDRGARRDRPLVKVNCSAISAGLVESEFFGHVKGAFTGALERRVGRFELANGGTIFLDEVGELPLETQVKLLRVLQENEFEPVGSSRTVRVDVRVIAATNRDLEQAVRAGRFRSDLFYRLNVFPLAVPPLRERRSDIPQLVTFFLARFARRFGRPVETVSEEAMERLMAYAWPGNIRELQNVIERAVVLSRSRVLELDSDLLPAVTPGPASRSSRGAAGAALSSLEEVERSHILAVLESTGGIIEGPRGAATILKLHPNTLRSRMEKLGIRRPSQEAS